MSDLIREAIDIAERTITAAQAVQEQFADLEPRIHRLQVALDLQLTAVPDRITRAVGECAQSTGDGDDWTVRIPCTFIGEVDVVVFDDTGEAFWLCPSCGGRNEGRV